MRIKPILAVTAITILSAGAAYYSLRDNAPAKWLEETQPSISPASSLTMKNSPARDGRGSKPANSEQQLAQLSEKIADLDARLRYIEANARKQANNQNPSGPDKPDASDSAEKGKTKKFSEADFGHWMDKTLDEGYFDPNTTKLVMDQAEKSLANVPGVSLGDMRCGERFCRATLIPEPGKQVNISQVFDVSQFMGSATTINGPDGSVSVYFTQPGQSLDELRDDAQSIALEDISTE